MMHSKFLRIGIVVAVLTSAFVACNRAPARTNAQVAAEVQGTIARDTKVESKDITVQADRGVITLDGSVTSDVERGLAASDAAGVEGVKTVVNNLVVQQASLAAAPPPPVEAAPEPQVAAKPAPAKAQRPPRPASGLPKAPIADSHSAAAPPEAPASPVAAQAPPPPKKVTVPAGTQLNIRLNDVLDTEKNQIGDTFHATLGAPIVVDDETVIPSGADVTGRVVDVKSAGRFAGNSALTLELNSLSVNGRTYNIQTNEWKREGKGEGKNTAIKAGGGAALGAIIGGIAGGGKGAAIGSVAGAGAGTGVAATKKGEQIKLPSESSLSFLLINPVTVTAQATNLRNAGRSSLP